MTLMSVEQLTKTYQSTNVVDELTFSLEPGKCVALLGPNGAGKTTTLRMLAGFIKPTKGEIVFNEERFSRDVRHYVGYLPQYPVFHNWMSGEEFLIYVGQLAYLTKHEAKAKAEELLDLVNLSDAKKQRISKYSGGMKQRLGIAQALIHDPKLIILDEPVSSLDPIGRREVLNLIRELKKDATILFSTHILNDAEEVSEEILLMHKGKMIKQGAISDVSETQETTSIHLSFEDEPKFIEERLKEIDSVFNVNREEDGFIVTVHDINIARSQLLDLIKQEEWELTRFEIGKTSLEDIFMKAVTE
ncbi:ABC transporter ATP-binding protein [Alkalibacillus haloalkaliphilus]|uniref:ABC transporter ATP-binding protein n=1 Tax=Alkalibacillus haloalkaliphilus TaxID=94136 RepID=UPI002936BB13|nr:ABC transporter ATP-binding protein [Alkalibacillus haloalkaliphilus]MDV2581865.1 ABC transporter ATP-binding protein [Alkalibacillus haloalkaliphilus]